MKKRRFTTLLAAVLACAGLFIWSARATAISTTKTTKLADLAWISGRWGTTTVEEHWMQPAGGTMIGMARTIANNRTVEFEYLRIEERADGIYYVASPRARCPATDFKLTRVSDREAVFENPAHDFPKRISYRKNPNGSLTASVDAGEGTKRQSFEYSPLRE